MLIFRDKNNVEIKRGNEVEYMGRKFVVEIRDGGQLRPYVFDSDDTDYLLRNIETEKYCTVTKKSALGNRCITCEKIINPEDEVYEDGYFGQINCSWECAIEYMSDFFGLEEGETEKFKNVK